MKKNLLFVLLSLTIFFSLSFSASRLVKADNFIQVSAKSAYLCDAKSGTVIYAKNENDKLPIASMTKITLLILAFEKEKAGEFNLEEKITVSERASGMGGSQVFLQANKQYLASDLIKSIIIASANDASVAIAEHLFGSEENAVNAMNDYVKKLKLKNTLFSNCTGLNKPTQYSSAKDVAICLAKLCEFNIYFKYSSCFLDELVHPDGQKTTLTNTNKLVKFYSGCDGGKTGFTSEAGYCLSATAKRGNMRVIGVIINEPDSKTRFADCSKMFDYAFSNYENKSVLSTQVEFGERAQIERGKKNSVSVFPKEDYGVFSVKNKKENLSVEFIQSKPIKAPILKGDLVGTFIIYKDGLKIAEIGAVAGENVDRKSFYDYIGEVVDA